MSTGYCVVLTVTDSQEAADTLARSIVEARLAACVQVSSPIRSTYWWDGAVEDSQEWQLWCKTTEVLYDSIAAHIAEHHAYDVPEILRLPVEGGHGPYLQWVSDQTAPVTT